MNFVKSAFVHKYISPFWLWLISSKIFRSEFSVFVYLLISIISVEGSMRAKQSMKHKNENKGTFSEFRKPCVLVSCSNRIFSPTEFFSCWPTIYKCIANKL